MYDIITIGDTTIDTFLILDDNTPGCTIDKNKTHLRLNYGEKIVIADSEQSVGGNAANVAVGVQRLGGKTAIVTEVGDDLNGKSVIAELQKKRVDTKHVKIIKKADTRFAVLVVYRAERTILSSFPHRSYTLPPLPESRWLYYTSSGASFEHLQRRLVTHLRRHPSTLLACNPGSFQLRSGKKTFKKIFPFTSILFVNKEEAITLIGKRLSILALCAQFHKKGVRTIVITDSTRGSYASSGNGVFFMPPFPINPISKAGAGDAFASGFLSAWINKKSLPEAMRYGTTNAGGVIQHFGTQTGLLNQSQMTKLLERYKKIQPKLL